MSAHVGLICWWKWERLLWWAKYQYLNAPYMKTENWNHLWNVSIDTNTWNAPKRVFVLACTRSQSFKHSYVLGFLTCIASSYTVVKVQSFSYFTPIFWNEWRKHDYPSVTPKQLLIYYRKSGNFCYMKFSLEKFSWWKIFVGSTSYENISTQKSYNIEVGKKRVTAMEKFF